MNERWDLVGRQEELRLASELLDGPGVVLTGEAGVGKTRLGAEILERARADGMPVERVLCTTATAGIPLGALAPLLPSRSLSTDGSAATDHLALFGALREGVATRGGDDRLVLGVDDAHLLDELGASALLQLVVAGEVTVVATVRTGESIPDPVRRLWRDAGCARLELQNLSRDEVHELVEQVVDGDAAPSTSNRLWKLTLGNPMYVREVVAGALAAGTLAERRGVWVWSGDLAASTSLVELVADRLGRLDADLGSTVALVAAGEPLPFEMFRLAADDSILHRLEGAGLVQVVRAADGQVTVRLGHPLYGEVLRANDPLTAASQRRLLALVGDDPPAALCLPAAVWALNANVSLPAHVHLTAVEQARLRGDGDLALRLAAAAEEAGGGEAATMARGRATADDREAERTLVPLLEAADPAVRANAVTSLADIYRYGYHDLARSLALLDGVEGLESPWDDYVAGHRATLLAYSGRLPEAEAIALPLLGHDDARVRVRAMVPGGMALALGGRSESALSLIDERMGDAFSLGEDLAPAVAWWVAARLLTLLALGDHDALVEMMEAVHAQAPDDGASFLGHFALVEGRSLLIHGRPASATEKLRDALSSSQPGGEEEHHWAASLLAEALAKLGDVDGALVAWEQVDVDLVQDAVFHPDVLRSQAWVSAAQGLTGESREQVMRAADVAAAGGIATTEMTVLQDAARLGAAIGPIAARAAELVEWMEGPMPAAMQAHIAALDAGTPAALRRAAEQLEAAGMALCAAECALAAGDLREAKRLEAACEGARTPGLSAGGPDPLTPREREVASLAARGMTSRQVARRLDISVRTVDNHLSRVYMKLGVTSRDELSSALAEA